MAQQDSTMNPGLVITRISTVQRHFKGLMSVWDGQPRQYATAAERYAVQVDHYEGLQAKWCVLARGLWEIIASTSDPEEADTIRAAKLRLSSTEAMPDEYADLLSETDVCQGVTKNERNTWAKRRDLARRYAAFFFTEANPGLLRAQAIVARSRLDMIEAQPARAGAPLPGALPSGLQAYSEVAPAPDSVGADAAGGQVVDGAPSSVGPASIRDDESFAASTEGHDAHGAQVDSDTPMTGTYLPPSHSQDVTSGSGTGLSLPSIASGDPTLMLPSLNLASHPASASTISHFRPMQPGHGESAAEAEAQRLGRLLPPY